MKAINKIFSLWRCCLLLLPLVVGSCQETITADRNPAPEPLPGNGSARFSVRAGEVPLPSATKIGFYVKYTDENKGYQYNVAGKYDGSGWVAANDWISNNPATVVVYAPYNENHSKTEPHLSLNAALYGEDKDIVSGWTPFKAEPQEVVSVTLAHVYTRLLFKLTKGGDLSSAVINKIELHGADIYPTAKYNPFTEAYTVDGQTDPPASKEIVSLPVDPVLTVSTTPEALLDLLLIPVRQSFTQDAYLWVYTTTTGKHPMKVKIPRSSITTGKYPLAPGKQYTFNVTLSPTETSITNVTVSKWEDVDKGTVDTE